MSTIDLVVPAQISASPQPVSGQTGPASGLSLGTNSTIITGQDIVGGALPLVLSAQATTQPTWGRILRLQSPSAGFFDLGIDAGGNLFINSTSSTASVHVLSISPSGQVTIPNLVLTNLQSAPSGSIDLAVGANGTVYKQ
ncbi:MAG: hypothetical protein JO093_10505 [Acidobacteria bacterium]|nr:hypothetical protein [Acidobacteriota bacterium]MBV9070033.1 hypothetical protein [Acidobacteriota bacterium]MBV9186048.1 hypothetical protein [Acidobacteriota bacterium]